MNLVVDALAALRLARLARLDTITRPVRDRLFGATLGTTAAVRPARWLLDLLGCPWCLTVWTAIVVGVVRRTPARRLVDVLAAAQLAGWAWSVDPDRVRADR